MSKSEARNIKVRGQRPSILREALTPFTLHRMTLRIRNAIDKGQVRLMNEQLSIAQMEAEYLVLQLTANLLGDKPSSVRCEWPSDWWQHFKERWFPNWAKKRWPVLYNREELNAEVLYHRFKSPALVDEPHVIIFKKTNVA